MKEEEALEIFAETASVASGHFLLASGKHADRYVNKDGVYPYTTKLAKLCEGIAENFKNDNIEVVVSPVVGGVALSQWIANHLTRMTGREVMAVYAEKAEGGEFALRRGYDKIVAGKRVLVADDVLTTGGSIEGIIRAVKSVGGEVIGVGILWDRGGIQLEGVKFVSLINIKFPAWIPEECPLCAQKVPINTDLGRGKELAQKTS